LRYEIVNADISLSYDSGSFIVTVSNAGPAAATVTVLATPLSGGYPSPSKAGT
jgi:hypothetical protein